MKELNKMSGRELQAAVHDVMINTMKIKPDTLGLLFFGQVGGLGNKEYLAANKLSTYRQATPQLDSAYRKTQLRESIGSAIVTLLAIAEISETYISINTAETMCAAVKQGPLQFNAACLQLGRLLGIKPVEIGTVQGLLNQLYVWAANIGLEATEDCLYPRLREILQ